jgi:hypothetical protein
LNPLRSRQVFAAVALILAAVVITTLITAWIAVEKRGGGLEGWTGTYAEQLLGWALFSVPYLIAVWTPVMCVVAVACRLAHFSSRTSVLVSALAWTGLAVAFAYAV